MGDHPQGHGIPSHCAHCGTVMKGPFCHVCGQQGRNPLRGFRHALEDVFESFWHIDGRVFRTLRLLFVPGYVAKSYLEGHRTPYLPPLRLSLIASVLALVAVSFGVSFDTQIVGHPQLERAETLPALRQGRDALLSELEAQRDEAKAEGRPDALAQAERSIGYARERAAEREREMLAICGLAPPLPRQAQTDSGAGGSLHRLVETQEHKVARNQSQFVQAWLKALPLSVVLMLPIFALLLKWLHPRAGLDYLEHLVIALYGNAWAMLMITALCAALWVSRSGGAAAFVANIVGLLIALAIPIYFLFQQKRVYAHPWPLTIAKYIVVSSIYGGLLVGAVLSTAVVQFMIL
jgi:hypothetical protein